MAKKEEEDKIIDISLDQRLPELEEEVKRYLALSAELPINTIKYERVRIPKRFTSEFERNRFYRAEITKCVSGFNGMSGKMYFWYNYGWIEALGSSGKIQPEYRVADQ